MTPAQIQQFIDHLETEGYVLCKKEQIAWVRRHPDGALTAEFLEDAVIEPVRKNSGAWVPLYSAAPPYAMKEPVTNAECNGCDWTGNVGETVFCGTVGPLCPECRETVEVEPPYAMKEGEQPYWLCCGSTDQNAHDKHCIEAKIGHPERCRFGTKTEHSKWQRGEKGGSR